MNKIINFDFLEKRARNHLLSRIDPKFTPSQALIDEISLYQIELELQNEDLIEAELTRNYTSTKYQNLYNLSPIAYFTLDSQGIIIEVNHAGMNIFKREKQKLLNKCFSRFVAPDFLILFSGFLKELNTVNKLINCELKLLSGYSAQSFYELSGVSTVSVDNKVELLLSVVDVSKYKIQNEASDESINFEKKLSRYEFSNFINAKIAHELNNPLTVVLNYVDGCIKRIENNNCSLNDLLKPLKEASKQSVRASELILRLKNHQQYNEFNFVKEDIDDIVHHIVGLVKHENPELPVTFNFRQSPIPEIKLDKFLIEQVLINLFRNSMEALSDSETVNPTIIVETNRSGKDYISISIQDNGPGIAPESINRIFELYFTTKSYGMGLGLPMSLSIIKAHGGDISVTSDQNGTTFKFTLKISQN